MGTETLSPGDALTADIVGPLETRSKSGYRYFALFVDIASRYVFVEFLRRKSDIFQSFGNVHRRVGILKERSLKRLHSDNELRTDRFSTYCTEHGISQTFSSPFTPEENSIVERKNRSILDSARVLLWNTNFPKTYWAEAVQLAVQLDRLCPSRAVNGLTPHEAFFGVKPSLSHLRVFGATAYVWLPKSSRKGKMAARAVQGRMLAYPEDSYGFRVELVEGNRAGQVVVSSHVLFDEREQVAKSFGPAGAQRGLSSRAPRVSSAEHMSDPFALASVASEDDENVSERKTDRVVEAMDSSRAWHAEAAEELSGDSGGDFMVSLPPEIDARADFRGGEASVPDDGDSFLMHDDPVRDDFSDGAEERMAGLPVTPVLSAGDRSEEKHHDLRGAGPDRDVGRGSPLSLAVDDTSTVEDTEVPGSNSSESASGDALGEEARSSRDFTARYPSRAWKPSRRLLESFQAESPPCAPLPPLAARPPVLSAAMSRPENDPSAGFLRDAVSRAGGDPREVYAVAEDDSASPDGVRVLLSIGQAMADVDWSAAVRAELKAHRDMGSYEVVPRPPRGVSVLPSHWIMRKKLNPDGTQKCKARWVVDGNHEPMWAVGDTASPVAYVSTVRLMLAVAAQRKMTLRQSDFRAAFLNAPLPESSDPRKQKFAELPPGFRHQGMVARLFRAVYGLRSAPLAWADTLAKALRALGFQPSPFDQCLFHQWNGACLSLLVVHVDDIVLGSDSVERADALISSLEKQFNMSAHGEPEVYVGLEVLDTKDGIYLSQTRYARSVLKKFHYAESRSVTTPSSGNLHKRLPDEPAADATLYRAIVGSLLYLSTQTRPDLSYSVGVLARHQSAPSVLHLAAAKRVLRYLRGSLSLGLMFPKGGDPVLSGYCDSDYAGCADSRRSTSGYLFLYGRSPVSWRSKLQDTVAISSTEAEMLSLASGVQELLFLRGLLSSLGLAVAEATPVFEDNLACIALAKREDLHSRLKHQHVKQRFVQQHIREGSVEVLHVSSADQVADIFTKCLGPRQFLNLRDRVLFDVSPVSASYSLSDDDDVDD
jgi:hypothetical protein